MTLTYPLLLSTKLKKTPRPAKPPPKKIKNETKFARCPRTGETCHCKDRPGKK